MIILLAFSHVITHDCKLTDIDALLWVYKPVILHDIMGAETHYYQAIHKTSNKLHSVQLQD